MRDNAACAQYGCSTPTPTPSISVPSGPHAPPSESLPFTGYVAWFWLVLAVILIAAGIWLNRKI